MNDIIKDHFPVSIELGVLAMLFAVVVGIPLGILAALKQNSIFDYAAMTFANLGFALPSFLIATLLHLLLCPQAEGLHGVADQRVGRPAGRGSCPRSRSASTR